MDTRRTAQETDSKTATEVFYTIPLTYIISKKLFLNSLHKFNY